MVEFIVSLVVTGLLLAVYHIYAAKRSLTKPMTWGEAMIAATYVFAVFFWIYGVVPHYWLEWADKGLEWRADKFIHGPFEIVKDQRSGGWFPFTMNYIHLRDIIAVKIHIIFLGINIWYWNHWQTRAARAKAAETVQAPPSEFGRPLIRKGVR